MGQRAVGTLSSPAGERSCARRPWWCTACIPPLKKHHLELNFCLPPSPLGISPLSSLFPGCRTGDLFAQIT